VMARWCCCVVLVPLGLLGAAPVVWGEPITWSYQGSIVTTGPTDSLNHDSHVLIGSGSNFLYPGDQVQFADMAGPGSGSSSVTAFQMRSSADFSGGGPFSKDIHTFNLGFAIRDTASGATGAVSFQGTVDGSMKAFFDHNDQPLARVVDLQVGF